MDTLGTEIGQKMRSAVKAKLIELGTGSASGYIDDELPDYVMIMVANKRSRQQMIDDLSLFLGAQTETFVNWLHQVLQKLQEVTLPASAATKKKSTETEDKRKEKKRKDKKTKRRDRSTDNEEDGTDATGPTTRASDGNNTPPQPVAVLPGSSITEVFANQYIEKAKKSLENAPNTKKTPHEPTAAGEQRSRTPPTTRGGFEIPSITEIASAAVVRKHHKELCELEEIQQRINEAKRHLKSLGTDISDDDDEDLLHLKANEDDLAAAESRSDQPPAALGRSNKTGDRETMVSKQRQRITIAPQEPSKTAQPNRSTTQPATVEATPAEPPTVAKKRSILDRLGTKSSSVAESTEGAKARAPAEPIVTEPSTKPEKKSGSVTATGSTNSTKSTIISLSAHRREEREIYVPLFRRKEAADDHAAVKDRPRHEPQARGRSRERNNRATRSPVARLSSFRADGNSSRNRDNNFRRGAREEHPPVRASRDARDRSRSRERSRGAGRDRSASSIGQQSKNGTDSVRARIGSRVIVLPPKPEFQEDVIEVPVASVIKVQPRPVMPKSKQPSKNLLLKAMAEAQRSTVADLRKTIDNTGPVEGNAPLYTRMEGKRKLLIEIPGAASIHPEVEVQYEEQDDEHYQQYAAASAYPGDDPDDEEVHEVDIANQVLMEECDVDEEFKDILQGENETEKQRAHLLEMHPAAEYAEAEGENVTSETAKAVGDDEDTKFVVTLDGAYKPVHDGNVSPSHTPPPPPSSTGGPGGSKGRLSVKDRIGFKQSSNSREQSRRSPKPKDSKELEETLKKRKERFSEKLVGLSATKLPAKKTPSPPPASKQQLQPRSPKPSASSRSSHSTQSHSSSHRRTPSLSPERGPRLRHTSPLEKPSQSKRALARNAPSSPGHLNELLLQRTKELMDDSVSSSPIYMSKSDYDKMEPSSRKRKRVSPIQFDLTDEDDLHDSEDDYHRDRRARSRDERNPRRSRQRDSEERRSVPRKESRRDWDRENERRGDSNSVLHSPGRKIKKLESSRKFDDLPPLLSAVSVSDGKSRKGSGNGGTIKDRCKYFPTCRQGESCEFLHPSTPCKAFPSCKFGDKCLYLHPMCKYDLTCHRLDCNFMHTKSSSAVASSSSLAAPPLASSVVPVQNYKTISAKPLPPLCKYYPNCVNSQCPFYHPKMCRFGRLCVNKVECNFYHYELPPNELHDAPAKDKFKWISPFSA
uniref:Zinc finger CCCH domain-containing protein 14 n=1 Tax=Anopheles atroparvus TaxID=41427 RepID=A0A182ITY7_ANOAO